MKDEIPVSETIITIGEETIPARTAASPITSVPRMETACPMADGIRILASRSPSKTISIMNASKSAGNGTGSRAAAILNSRLAGIISG
ncbi:hypothetical protein D3C76_1662480 [compost metagenome]